VKFWQECMLYFKYTGHHKVEAFGCVTRLLVLMLLLIRYHLICITVTTCDQLEKRYKVHIKAQYVAIPAILAQS